ncbi:MAG: heavy metal translocating P-type ATPase metal-binding domain-containing protein [Pirellula sp.]
MRKNWGAIVREPPSVPRSERARETRPCAHCGLPTMAFQDAPRVFCCNGCMGAHAMIHEMGLEDFYALRGKTEPESVPKIGSTDGVLEDLDAAGVVVQSMDGGLCRVRLAVDGVHCAACSWLIERIQPMIRGLHCAQVRMSDQTIELIYDPKQTTPANVSRRLGQIGYTLSPWIADDGESVGFLQQQRSQWMGIALAAFFAANAMWIGVALYAGESTGISAEHEYFLRWVGTVLSLLAVLLPGRIFFETAWQAIQTKTPHVDIPVALSLLVGSLGSGIGAVRGSGQIYFDSLASLIFLLRIGRYIQFRAQHRTTSWIGQWMRLNSVNATRIEQDGSFKKVPAHRLQINDRVAVHAGESMPADGTIVSLSSLDSTGTVDMSLLNGESAPVTVRIGDPVLSGTTNLSSPMIVSVTATGESSRVGKLMELVRCATTHQTPWIRAADRIGKWFVMVVLALALVTFCVWTFLESVSTATQHTMALLTIACPCALALAAPLVLTVALGRAAKQQIWIRDGNCLEKLAVPGTLWLDKTGTLTHGRLTVLDWVGDESWLSKAAVIERLIKHPVATAIMEYVQNRLGIGLDDISKKANLTGGIQPHEPRGLRAVNGKGVAALIGDVDVCIGTEDWIHENGVVVTDAWSTLQAKLLANGQSVVWMSANKVVVGMFGMGDPLRIDAINTLQAIAARGWRIGILSGDRQEIVDRVAAEIRQQGVELFSALGQQTPEQKLERIQGTRGVGTGPCVMVGDGINDAAALALADVGIAIRGSSDQSLRFAPIYLGTQRIDSVVQLLDASCHVVRGIRRCFIASLLYNSVTISLAIAGWIHPLVAAILMPISGLTVLTMAITTKSFGIASGSPSSPDARDLRDRLAKATPHLKTKPKTSNNIVIP